MHRPSAFISVTAGVALVFCLACLTGERFGVSQAHAQPAGTPNPAGTPLPYGDPGTDPGDGEGPTPTPCPPPESFTYFNNTSNQKDITYTCKGSGTTSQTVGPGETIIFDADGHCSNCDDSCTCIECKLVQLIVDSQVVPICEAQLPYMSAYGLDLFAEPFILIESTAPQYDRNGRRIPGWAIPVLNDRRELVGWEFTVFEPVFSAEDGEVVIRARRDQVAIQDGQVISIAKKGEIIGGPEGITIDDE